MAKFYLSLIGAIGAVVAALVAVVVGLGSPVKAEGFAEQEMVACYTEAQIDILARDRLGGMSVIEAVNALNRGHSPVCLLTKRQVPPWEPSLRYRYIGGLIYEEHILNWSVLAWEGLRIESRVVLVLAPLYAI